MSGTRRPGINRLNWGMRYTGARVARLRTKPPGNPHVVEEKRYVQQWEREGWYPVQSWGTSAGFQGFMVAPGIYTVKLRVGDKEFTQTLEVRKDPRSAGTLADIKEQVKLELDIRDDLNASSDMISRIEWMKKQLFDMKDVVSAGAGSRDMIKTFDELGAKLQSIEDELFQPTIAEGDTKSFRDPQKLYEKFSVLAGDIAGSVDFAPNQQQREVYAALKERLAAQKGRFEGLLKTDLAAFNDLLKKNDIAGVIVPRLR